MEWYFVLLVIVAAVVILIGGIYWLIPKLIRKGIDVSGVLGNTGKMLNVADTLVDTMKGFMSDTAALNIVDNIKITLYFYKNYLWIIIVFFVLNC